MTRTRPCVDCGETKWMHGRGLCSACYMRHLRAGTIERYLSTQVRLRARQPRLCARCKRWRDHCGRGLCTSCHVTLRRQGGLGDYPRKTWPRAELLEEWDHLRRAGVDLTEAARRIGISRDGLEKAIERAGKRAA